MIMKHLLLIIGILAFTGCTSAPKTDPIMFWDLLPCKIQDDMTCRSRCPASMSGGYIYYDVMACPEKYTIKQPVRAGDNCIYYPDSDLTLCRGNIDDQP